MKLYKSLLYVLMILPTLLLQSCLKDQEDIFDSPSSIRMQEVLDNAKKVLTSSENGWIFDYYPDRDLSYGGYAYTVKFDSKEATVRSELKIESGNAVSSLYKLNNDNGPMLSFDSYNTLMHFFATPSSSKYEGQDGDFEFIIMNVTDDLITLRGKRTGNTMYLRRLTKDAKTYIAAAAAVIENIVISSAKGKAGALDIACEINLDTRRLNLTYMKGDLAVFVSECYLPNETGIRFYNPIEIDGATLSELAYNPDTNTFSGKDSKNNDVTLVGQLPADYTPFDQFAGIYDLKYSYGTIEVTFVPDKENYQYLIQGLNPSYNIVAKYIKSKGCLNITSQKVGDSGSQQIWFCGWGLKEDGGNLTWITDCGMFLTRDIEHEGIFNFTPNSYSDLHADSFILFAFNGTPSSNSVVGLAEAPWLIADQARMPYLEYIVKK